MCGTCGCGETNGISILTPGEHREHLHAHEHGLEHDHLHEAQIHDHNGHHHHHHPHGDHDHNHSLKVEQDILRENDLAAARNRGYFEARDILSINLVSSPGSGKTSFLETTLRELREELDFYVIEGDQRTFNDAERIDALQVPVVQINTGQGCHLESDMVFGAMRKLEMKEGGVLMIENVGNLVCPAMFDLGEGKRVVIISVTEGDDKPIKYPTMFEGSDLCVINKIDLLPYVNFDVSRAKDFALRVNPHIEFIETSATTGQGMDSWYEWLRKSRKELSESELSK